MVRCVRIIAAVILLVVVSTFVTPCQAQSVALIKEKARRLYFGDGVQRNLPAALSLYLEAAALGDPEAQYIAGGMYFKGRGTVIDREKAFSYLYRAAKNGKSSSVSQKIIAQSFLAGESVPKNFEEAIRWYTMAAENGDSEAKNELAFIYFTGNGVKKDYKKAYTLFQEAANMNHTLAQYNLGIMLYSGEGVPDVDLPGAYAWFSIAATNGHLEAAQAQSYLETVLTKEEIVQAQQKAENLYKTIKSGK
jgi:uncharacterized protein